MRETVLLDDGAMPAHLAVPAGATGPALVLIQEIFGVNDYVRGVADRLTGLGYVVLCPDLYWRLGPGIELPHDQAGLARAMELVMQLDLDRAVTDCGAALAHARGLPAAEGGAGLIGFCLGGSLAFLAAAEDDPSPDAVVSYYGSSVPEHVELMDRIPCPVLLHFGGNDPYIPRGQVELVEKAAAGHDHVEVLVQAEAGHAFDNDHAPGFHDPAAAATAWEVTEAFLNRNLPVAE